MKIAHICTPHGFGHITRQIALASALKKHNHHSTFFCHNASLVHESLPKAMVIHKYADVGIVQKDSMHIDIKKTRYMLEQRCNPHAFFEWVSILKGYDLVIADVPPLIFAAASKAGTPVIGIGNFDWVWIYEHFPELHTWAKQMRTWQKGHDAIQLFPGTPLNLSIQHSAKWLSRNKTGFPANMPKFSILVGFGGLGITDIDKLPIIDGVHWILTPPMPILSRDDIIYATDTPFSDLTHAVDIIFSKAGYGILAESQCSGTPQIWMKRPLFPEANILEKFARSVGDIIIDSSWGSQEWNRDIRKAIKRLQRVHRTPQNPDNDDISQWIHERYHSIQ